MRKLRDQRIQENGIRDSAAISVYSGCRIKEQAHPSLRSVKDAGDSKI